MTGREEGQAQGVRLGEVILTLKQLHRRLGTFDPTLESRIQDLTTTQLEDLGEALIDFTTENDLHTWLDGHTQA